MPTICSAESEKSSVGGRELVFWVAEPLLGRQKMDGRRLDQVVSEKNAWTAHVSKALACLGFLSLSHLLQDEGCFEVTEAPDCRCSWRYNKVCPTSGPLDLLEQTLQKSDPGPAR